MVVFPARPIHTRPLVEIVTGSFGAGHDAAAAAIAGQLQADGVSTRTWDIVDLMPGHLGRLLRSGYLKQIQALPSSWRWMLDQIERRQGAADLVGSLLATSAGPLLDVAADGASMFVSTHPFGSQVLGQLRATGLLHLPVTTYLTDMSVHRLWVHPGVDRHLAIHDLPALEAGVLGGRGVETVVPAVSTAFSSVYRSAVARSAARQTFGLPPHAPLALVTGGSCGIGQLMESARDLVATGLVVPIVLCGTNRRLLARVRRTPGMHGLGWVSDMPGLLSAVDVVIQNSGGMTTLEARAAGVPLLTYRCLPGHGEANAAALAAARLVAWARTSDDLDPLLRQALAVDAPVPVPVDLPSAATALLDPAHRRATGAVP